MGKMMSPLFQAVLDRILFILAGNDNIHESSIGRHSGGFSGNLWRFFWKPIAAFFQRIFLIVLGPLEISAEKKAAIGFQKNRQRFPEKPPEVSRKTARVSS